MCDDQQRPRRLVRNQNVQTRSSAPAVLEGNHYLPRLPIESYSRLKQRDLKTSLDHMAAPRVSITNVKLQIPKAAIREKHKSQQIVRPPRRLTSADEPTKEFIDRARKAIEAMERANNPSPPLEQSQTEELIKPRMKFSVQYATRQFA